MKIITRQQAISANLPRYFTGIPCRNGHISERYRTGGKCIQCEKESHRVKPLEGGFNHRVFILGAIPCSQPNS